MKAHECHHGKQWTEEGEAHDCWSTTEAALTEDLSDDLREAWERLRETAVEFGDQRIYASGSCIVFAPRVLRLRLAKAKLARSLCVPRPRTQGAAGSPDRTHSKTKFANILKITHRDEVEPPMTDWLREAYQLQDVLAAPAAKKSRGSARTRKRKR